MADFKRDADRGEDIGFYGAVKHYLEKHGKHDETMASARTGEEREEETIFRKLQTFMDLLADLRRESLYLPVSRLIGRIFDRTGYDEYAAAMPAGKTRQANLAMLLQKA